MLGEGAAAGRPRRSRSSRASATRTPRTCRTCGTILDTAAERKIGRCAACPPTYDEAVFEALRAWRKEAAAEAKMPAFVVFTDATLQLIAEHGERGAIRWQLDHHLQRQRRNYLAPNKILGGERQRKLLRLEGEH